LSNLVLVEVRLMWGGIKRAMAAAAWMHLRSGATKEEGEQVRIGVTNEEECDRTDELGGRKQNHTFFLGS
jgi:hypothetical protein